MGWGIAVTAQGSIAVYCTTFDYIVGGPLFDTLEHWLSFMHYTKHADPRRYHDSVDAWREWALDEDSGELTVQANEAARLAWPQYATRYWLDTHVTARVCEHMASLFPDSFAWEEARSIVQ